MPLIAAVATAEGITQSSDNAVNLLTRHRNGSLNLWQLCMEDDRRYAKVASIAHRYRMCGHRFKTAAVAAHPTLPLLLTTSSFSASAADAGESELILWQITPVGPLCKSGGVRELSRMTAKTARAFKSISWAPAIIPRYACCTLQACVELGQRHT